MNCLSKNTRQKIGRFLRRVENSDELRITLPEPKTVENDLEILLRFWQARWGAAKGKKLGGIVNNFRRMLLHCFRSESLFLPILWKGNTPLAALASLIDVKKGSLNFFIGGRDQTFTSPPPGFVLHAYSIRFAISQGFTTYDFLKGDEAYKYRFGAEDRYTTNIFVTTATKRNLGSRLDTKCLPIVFERCKGLLQTGHRTEAELGMRQVLDVEPRSSRP